MAGLVAFDGWRWLGLEDVLFVGLEVEIEVWVERLLLIHRSKIVACSTRTKAVPCR